MQATEKKNADFIWHDEYWGGYKRYREIMQCVSMDESMEIQNFIRNLLKENVTPNIIWPRHEVKIREKCCLWKIIWCIT